MTDPADRRYLADLRDQAIALAADEGLSAEFIRDELGIPRSVRTVERWINAVHGRRPGRRTLERRDLLRTRVVAYMAAQGLDPQYCYLGHRSIWPCRVRELRKDDDLGSLVFVCDRHATVADR